MQASKLLGNSSEPSHRDTKRCLQAMRLRVEAALSPEAGGTGLPSPRGGPLFLEEPVCRSLHSLDWGQAYMKRHIEVPNEHEGSLPDKSSRISRSGSERV
jgi:hypothetical protein